MSSYLNINLSQFNPKREIWISREISEPIREKDLRRDIMEPKRINCFVISNYLRNKI